MSSDHEVLWAEIQIRLTPTPVVSFYRELVNSVCHLFLLEISGYPSKI